jgi:hypothetical protein
MALHTGNTQIPTSESQPSTRIEGCHYPSVSNAVVYFVLVFFRNNTHKYVYVLCTICTTCNYYLHWSNLIVE